MKKPQRAKKGSVSVKQRGEYLHLRWSISGREFSLSAGLNTPLNTYNARELATKIERDIAIGQFDSTLAKYKPTVEAEPIKHKTTVELFQDFIQFRRNTGTSEQAISTRYRAMLANLERFRKSIESETDARQFVDLLRTRQQPLTANQNLTLLKSFGDWTTNQKLTADNWFANIKPLKQGKTTSPTRKPFSRDEIKRLLATAKTHPKFYRWHDFCMVLLYLGLRPSEAIGLRWQDVDLHHPTVTVAESLTRDGDGRSSGTSRVRKPTKTQNSRTLPLPPSLLAMLKGRAAATQGNPDSLIFLSPKGKPIDDHSFSQRVWKPLCIAAEVPYRVPYACRHTVLSHSIESGMSIYQAQYIAGHASPKLILDTYGHMINRPKLIDWGGEE